MYGPGDGLMASDGAVWLLYISKLPLNHLPSCATSSIRLKMSRIAAGKLTSVEEIKYALPCSRVAFMLMSRIALTIITSWPYWACVDLDESNLRNS